MEIKEFVSENKSDTAGKNIKKRASQAKHTYLKKNVKASLSEWNENKPLIMLCTLIVLSVLTIVLGMLVFHVPVVTACVVILIEALLAACLHNLPIWVHGIVLLAELILGIAVTKVIFMILADLCYLAAIYMLKFQYEMNK